LVSAGGAISIIVGIIILVIGLLILGWSSNLPVLFAGQYLILSGLVIVAGIVLIVLGDRTGRNKVTSIPPIICTNCSSSNPSSSEFCSKCGIKIR